MVSKGLRVHEVQFAYPSLSRSVAPIPVLKSVSLELEPGQVVVSSGSSGCSKSALLQIISGLLKSDSGIIVWDNQDLRHTPVHRRGFAMLFQGGELFSGRDVAGNTACDLEMRRPRPTRAQREARVTQMLHLVHLKGYENHGTSTFSGGQAGRAALARVLTPTLRLLLFDEPLAAPDGQLKYELVRDIHEILKAPDNTALYVTHDQSGAKLVADRVNIMHQGETMAQSSLESLRHNPPNPGITKFLGL